ncbi:uncharacterized protein LOC142831191 [Pelodiscus sinensis]|uniref:uncharacterized protein LOC142831191 n=1 Tax=Pelodiscus sinensis TaxID=13735 RepID=UPI003F6AF1FA
MLQQPSLGEPCASLCVPHAGATCGCPQEPPACGDVVAAAPRQGEGGLRGAELLLLLCAGALEGACGALSFPPPRFSLPPTAPLAHAGLHALVHSASCSCLCSLGTERLVPGVRFPWGCSPHPWWNCWHCTVPTPVGVGGRVLPHAEPSCSQLRGGSTARGRGAGASWPKAARWALLLPCLLPSRDRFPLLSGQGLACTPRRRGLAPGGCSKARAGLLLGAGCSVPLCSLICCRGSPPCDNKYLPEALGWFLASCRAGRCPRRLLCCQGPWRSVGTVSAALCALLPGRALPGRAAGGTGGTSWALSQAAACAGAAGSAAGPGPLPGGSSCVAARVPLPSGTRSPTLHACAAVCVGGVSSVTRGPQRWAV